MKLFLDTANVEHIRAAVATGCIDGITTNPSNLSKEGGDPNQRVQELCALMVNKEISIEVTETEPQAVYAQARKIAALAPHVIVKIPCHPSLYSLISKLVHEGVALNITLVFSLFQGLCMAKLGVRYISPFVGRWQELDVDGTAIVHDLRMMIDQYAFSSQILASSLRDISQVHRVINAGAHAATLSPALFAATTNHLLTNQGMARFAHDWRLLGNIPFPR